MEVNRHELIERVKAYNAKLKEANSQAATLKAHISYSENDVNNSCRELSELLNREVTPDNLEAIRDAEIAKVMNNLEMGEEIIRRIETGDDFMEQPVNIPTENNYTPNQDTKESILNDSSAINVGKQEHQATTSSFMSQAIQQGVATPSKDRQSGFSLSEDMDLYEI